MEERWVDEVGIFEDWYKTENSIPDNIDMPKASRSQTLSRLRTLVKKTEFTLKRLPNFETYEESEKCLDALNHRATEKTLDILQGRTQQFKIQLADATAALTSRDTEHDKDMSWKSQ